MVLLDTHTLLWVFTDSEKLSQPAIDSIISNERYVSIASFWEIAIKSSLPNEARRIHLSLSISDLEKECIRQSISILPITPGDCELVQTLPYIHMDPFDRIIIAQAINNKMELITKDQIIWRYNAVQKIW